MAKKNNHYVDSNRFTRSNIILGVERRIRENVFRPIRNSYEKIFTRLYGRQWSGSGFFEHERLIQEIWGIPADFAVAQISNSLLSKFRGLIESGTLGVCKLNELHDRTSENLVLSVDRHTDEYDTRLDKMIRVHSLHNYTYNDAIIRDLHDEIRALFSSYIRSPFIFVNTRMWATLPQSEKFAMSAAHRDGFVPGHLKCMIYLSPMDQENGYLSIENSDEANERVFKNRPEGTCVCFRNSDVMHAAMAGTKGDRVSIEVTIFRSFISGNQNWPGHFYGRHTTSPEVAYEYSNAISAKDTLPIPQSELTSRDFSSGIKINIGSGRRNWNGWVCLDELEAKGVTRLTLDHNTILPFPDEAVSLTYSSHCLEHLSDATIDRILEEMARTMGDGALAVIKIPDFDWFLAQYRLGIENLLKNKAAESNVWSWKSKNVEDNTLNRLAQLFCGYWNKEYGDHFSGKINRTPGAYHGPPVVDPVDLEQLLRTASPKTISERLRAITLTAEDFAHFNHQNAWSTREFIELFSRHGFLPKSLDKQLIISKFEPIIPDLLSMEDISAFYLFERTKKQ